MVYRLQATKLLIKTRFPLMGEMSQHSLQLPTVVALQFPCLSCSLSQTVTRASVMSQRMPTERGNGDEK